MGALAKYFNNIEKISAEDQKALLEYMRSVDILSKDGLNLEFNNKDQFHGAFVMSKIFETSKESIKIFAGNFSGEISDNPIYTDSLEKAIRTDVKNIEVVFEQTPKIDSKCLSLLKDLKKEGHKISTYVLNADYREKLIKTFNNPINHFTIGDDRMFRYETDTDHFKAFCNFDDKDTVSVLLKNFLIIRLNSSEFSLN